MIRRGPVIAVNAARRIIKLFIDAEESDMSSPLTTIIGLGVTALLHAAYVLVVHVVRHPQSRMAEQQSRTR